jgi:hypothetical protein
MRNHHNMVVVWYPNKGLRIRNCQTTVYPEGYIRHTTVSPKQNCINFNNWAIYIRQAVEDVQKTAQPILDEFNKLIRNSTKVQHSKK